MNLGKLTNELQFFYNIFMNKITVNNYDLDEEQLKPILENAKYSLIIAGAGSGKTLTLIGKIKYLLENNLFKPEEICTISFTNEATNNLKKNILKNCGLEVPTFTFHKLALDILKRAQIHYTIATPDLLEFTADEFFQTKCFGNNFLAKKCYKIFDIPSFFSWEKILKSNKYSGIKKQILTFINLFKANGYFQNDLKEILKGAQKEPLLYIIYAIYLFYESNKESSGTLDFDDIILKATSYLREHECSLPYKLLIIDEFQDTSLCRFQFVEEILKQTDASLCVVGDDYQSIYHFSGCDLTIFLNFSSYFPKVKIYKLETTYRNSDELIKSAGNFIQKNPNQIKKELKSSKHLSKPIKLIYYKNKDSILEKVLKRIPEDQEIFLLGRNHFDLKKYTKNLTYSLKENNELVFAKFPNHKIRFLTVHAAKGLESDVVILLNLENSLYGFPTLLKDEKVLSLIKKVQPYPYEEERRLFYVALTRTKSFIYLLVPKYMPSCFIKEIKKDKNVENLFL